MIASLRGAVEHIGLDSLVLSVHGVGYRIHATPGTLANLRHGAEIALATTLVVREDSLTLFGFESPEERDMYETLQTVSGVGPRLALAMLAVHSPDDLRRAVADEDLKTLQLVPGVGPKSAKRLVLELHGKIGTAAAGGSAGAAPVTSGNHDVLDALTGLGWSTAVAQRALDVVQAREGAPNAVGDLLREVLKELGGKSHG